ncbi:MAG: hypothetical protein ACI3XG_06685 [Faecousia sp.]
MDNHADHYLLLDHLVFDHIEFTRHGFRKNDSTPAFSLEVKTGSFSEADNLYRVTLVLRGEKEAEYSLSISLSGFYKVNNATPDYIDSNILIQQNAVAILMPYLRSEVTLLTSQPETDAVVLPVINVANMLQKEPPKKA